MRAYSDEVLAKHWSLWFPNVSPTSLLLKWDHGFVRSATLRPAADVARAHARTAGDPGARAPADVESLVIRDASLVTAAALQKLPPMRRLTVPLMALFMMRLDAPEREVHAAAAARRALARRAERGGEAEVRAAHRHPGARHVLRAR